MFEEKEPGKPKNWIFTVTIITLILFLNIAVIIVCRILLDSRDEDNHLWLTGKVRENLTLFLGMFAMSFCFYCCCCFCCGGSLCRWIANWQCKCFDTSKLLSTSFKTTQEAPITHKSQKNSFPIFNAFKNGDCIKVDVTNDTKSFAYDNSVFKNSSGRQVIRDNPKIILSCKEELTDYSKFRCQSQRRKSL